MATRADCKDMIKPLFARVLLRREKEEKIGSIILPDDAQKRYASLRCKVLAVGPAADPSIAVGTTVLIGQHAGAWINLKGTPGLPDGEERYIVQDEDILCEVRDE